jgi:hypothetical protein
MEPLSRDTIRNLLLGIRKVVIDVAMTGSMEDSGPYLADMYNKCLSVLREQGDAVVSGLFIALDRQEASVDEIGAAATLLASYLGGQSSEPDEER